MHVQNSMCIFIGEVLKIEVSDGLVHSLGSCQKVNLYPARAFTGARVLRTLHTFTVRNDPMCVQSSMFIGEVFPIEVLDGLVHSLGRCQKVNLYPARVITGARVLRSFYAIRI